MGILSSIVSQLISEHASERMKRGIAEHANRRKSGDPHPTSVQTGWTLKVLGLIACAIIVPIAVIVTWADIVGQPVNDSWIVAPFFGAVAIWLCLSCVDSFIRRIEWSETHVRFRAWTGSRTMPWEEIVGLEEKSYPPHIRIAFRDGTGFAIDETMQGSHYFMAILERRMTPEGGGESRRRKRRQRGKKS